jgi:hypothetical protein
MAMMFRLKLDALNATRSKNALEGITGHSVQVGKGGMRSPRFGTVLARKSLRPTACAIRAPEQEGVKTRKRSESTFESGHTPKNPF